MSKDSKWNRTVGVKLWAWSLFWFFSLFSGNIISVVISGFLLVGPFIWSSWTDPPKEKDVDSSGSDSSPYL